MKLRQNVFNDSRGVTIVELLVALAILSMVISLGYSIFGFGKISFNRGETKANIQQNMRLVSDYITKEVRFAYGAEILKESSLVPVSADINPDDKYIFINNDGKLELRSSAGSAIFSDTLMPGKNLILTFKNSNNLLGIEITNNIDNIAINTKVMILNLAGSIGGLQEGSAIRLTKSILQQEDNVPIILTASLEPESHKKGNDLNIQVSVITRHVGNGTTVTAEFLDSNEQPLSPKISGTSIIWNNSAVFNLGTTNILSAGQYLVKVTVNGVLSHRYVSYEITENGGLFLNPIDFLIYYDMAIFASTAGDDVDRAVKIIGSTGVCHAVGTNSTSFDSFSFGWSAKIKETIYLAIEQDYHLGLSEWESRNYAAGSEVLFNNEMYRATHLVNAQPGTNQLWVRFAPLPVPQTFPDPDIGQFPTSPSISGAEIDDASGRVRIPNYNHSGSMLYFPNATELFTNNNTLINRSIYAPNAVVVELNSSNTINGFIHAPKARMTSGNGTDIDGYIYIDGSKKHVLTGTSVNGTIFVSNTDSEGQVINLDAEIHFTGNRPAVDGIITHVVSNGTDIRLEADHIQGVIYAPDANVKLLGSSSVKGSIVAYTIELNGGLVGGKCNIIFDEDIIRSFPSNLITTD